MASSIVDIIDVIISVKKLALFSQTWHVKFNQKLFKVQHSKKHMRTVKIMETLVDMTISIVVFTYLIVIMASIDYGPDSISK